LEDKNLVGPGEEVALVFKQVQVGVGDVVGQVVGIGLGDEGVFRTMYNIHPAGNLRQPKTPVPVMNGRIHSHPFTPLDQRFLLVGAQMGFEDRIGANGPVSGIPCPSYRPG